MAALCEKLGGSAPLAAATANDQVIASGNTAGERVDQLVGCGGSDEPLFRPPCASDQARGIGGRGK